MKRFITFLVITMALLLTISLVVASSSLESFDSRNVTKTSCSDSSVSVCSSTPDSYLGFGAVELCGYCFTCGLADGVCPEDFYSNGRTASCASCPDPDCKSTVDGFVFQSDNTSIVSGADVLIKYPGNTNYSLLRSTNSDGFFNSSVSSAENVQIMARYNDGNTQYSSNELSVNFFRNKITHVNLTLYSASCESDCTLTTDSLCNAGCEGKNNCSFPSDAKHNLSTVLSILNGTSDGTKTILSTETNGSNKTIYFVDHCIGPIQNQNLFGNPSPPNGSNSTPLSGGTLIDDSKLNLVTKNIRVYNVDGEIVTMVIVYWEGEEE